MSYWVAGSTIVATVVNSRNQSRAASQGAGAQAAAGEQSIEQQRASLERARADLQPFREAGAETLPGLTELIQSPQAQEEFVTENPFFQSLTGEAQQRLSGNQATSGQTEGTKKALENSLLLLGTDLVSQNVDQRFNLARLGANAAAGQATGTLQTGRSISDLATQIGNVQAAGAVGGANAQSQAVQDILQAIELANRNRVQV